MSIVAETDELRTTHDAATLLGYGGGGGGGGGADALVPRLVLETIAHLADEDRIGGDNPTSSEAQQRYRVALEDGVLKIMSKMGISVLDSYRSAQIFEALGLDGEVIDRCFTGTTSVLGGHRFVDLARTVLAQHATAFAGDLSVDADSDLPSPGVIKWRKGGEFHDMSKPVIDSLARRARARPVPGDRTVRARRRREGGRRRSDGRARAAGGPSRAAPTSTASSARRSVHGRPRSHATC